MKRAFVLCVLTAVSLTAALAQTASFYDYTVKDIDGRDYPLHQLRGKKVMVVNVASQCGLTPQYAQLQALYEKYGDGGLVILGFPSNDFMGQEPGTEAQIAAFCDENYGITFPLMAKVTVKGDDMAPLYRWLTSRGLNGREDSEVAWNFQKYLIDENGNLARVVPPTTLPDSQEIIEWIEGK